MSQCRLLRARGVRVLTLAGVAAADIIRTGLCPRAPILEKFFGVPGPTCHAPNTWQAQLCIDISDAALRPAGWTATISTAT